MNAQRPWLEPTPRLRAEMDVRVLAACDDDDLLAQILLNRGFSDPDAIRAFLDPVAYEPAPPEALPDLAQASERIRQTLSAGGRILVWGDFDVDGQTATALLIDGLRCLGADVAFYIPKRATESHGIKIASLKQQIAQHRPALLLTCDTGSDEFEAIDYARSVGLPVIVTDHHDLTERLPDADAVINPKRLPPDHALRGLPGVGVAYKLMQHVYTALDRATELENLLDLVALGIVSDIAPQVNDTRYLLQIGLERLRRTHRLGLQALIEVARITPHLLDAEEIAYQLAPRMNAAGRLDDAALCVRLLTTQDSTEARVIAEQLEGLNNERKLRTRQVEDEAQAMLKANPELAAGAALVLHNPDWQAGLLGGVANRLAERFARPVVMFGGAGPIISGSARSFGGVDIHSAIAAQADLLNTFGGHTGAAGLSLMVENLETFRQRLAQAMPAASGPEALRLDAEFVLGELSPELYYRLQRLGPFGEGNPPLVLLTCNLHLSHAGQVGRENRHWRLVVEDDSGLMQQVMWWDGGSEKLPEGRFDIAYRLSLNERLELEAALVDLRVYAAEVAQQAVEDEETLTIKDWRRESDPAARLERILSADPAALVWAEGYSRRDLPHFKRRADLQPAATLVIYNPPSDPETLAEAMRVVSPQMVHIFGVQPPFEDFESFLRQLVLAARNAREKHEGVVPISLLCGATAASAQVVRAGLDLLAAEGQFTWAETDNGTVYFTDISQPLPPAAARRALDKLHRFYGEMEAYRQFFRIMPLRKQLVPPTA